MRLFHLRHVPVWAVLLLAATGLCQETVPGEPLQREWLDIQVRGDQPARKAWWQELGPRQLRALIHAGVEVSVADGRGWTPLHSAARYSHDPGVLLVLLEAGAAIDVSDSSGDTPLHWAAAENPNVGVTDALLRAGADVNASDRYGWLPIHTACNSNSNPEVIRALLAAGARRDARAYFVLFSPGFLLKHNSNMSDPDKERALILLQEPDRPVGAPPG